MNSLGANDPNQASTSTPLIARMGYGLLSDMVWQVGIIGRWQFLFASPQGLVCLRLLLPNRLSVWQGRYWLDEMGPLWHVEPHV